MLVKYSCDRCPGTKSIQVESGQKIKKSIACPFCKTGRMRLPRAMVVGAKNSGGKTFRRKPF